MLSDEEQEADEADDAQQVHDECAAERSTPEQAHVEHRRGRGQLAAHEDDAERDARDEERQHAQAGAVHGKLLDPVDDGHERRHRERDADRVDATGQRVAALWHEQRRQHQQRQQHGHRHEEHRSPRIVLQQHPAHDRAECRSRREHRRPDRDGEPALVTVGEDAAQERERRGHEHRAEHAHQGASRDQQCGRRREGGERRNGREPRGTDQEQLAPPEPVAQHAHRHEQTRQHERVGVDDPELLRARRGEVEGDLGQGKAQHRVVDRYQQYRQHQHDKRCPSAPSDAGPASVCEGDFFCE